MQRRESLFPTLPDFSSISIRTVKEASTPKPSPTYVPVVAHPDAALLDSLTQRVSVWRVEELLRENASDLSPGVVRSALLRISHCLYDLSTDRLQYREGSANRAEL